MSAVLKSVQVASSIVPYSARFASDVMRLAREMHAETVMRDIPLNEAKLASQLKTAETHPSVYLRLWLSGDGVFVGGLYGMITVPYWTDERIAVDRAWFISPDRRGGIAAVRLLQDFEEWAKKHGVRWVMPGQTTGVRIEQTTRLFERCGYRVRGSNFFKEL